MSDVDPSWQSPDTIPPGVVMLRGRFGGRGSVLTWPEARLVGFEWFAKGRDGYFHPIAKGTLPFKAIGWRHPAPKSG